MRLQLCAEQCESESLTGERVDLNNETHGSRLTGGADITGRVTVQGRSRDYRLEENAPRFEEDACALLSVHVKITRTCTGWFGGVCSNRTWLKSLKKTALFVSAALVLKWHRCIKCGLNAGS